MNRITRKYSRTDYHPFGMVIEERSISSSAYRYGFNGQEKDDELSGGAGNNMNFGARTYSSRLGRWFKKDLLEREAPGLTPYRFAFNNPINYSDPDGNFEIDRATAAAFPILNSYLQNLSLEYSNKPEEFRKAFKEYGQLNDAQVKQLLEYKIVEKTDPVDVNNPRIIVEEMKGRTGQTYSEVQRDREGNLTMRNLGKIALSKELIDAFEVSQASLFATAVEKEGAKLMVESTLFHEFTHFGDNVDGKSDKSSLTWDGNKPQFGRTMEGGHDFEIATYGRNLGVGTTIHEAINDAEDYVRENNYNRAVARDTAQPRTQASDNTNPGNWP